MLEFMPETTMRAMGTLTQVHFSFKEWVKTGHKETLDFNHLIPQIILL